VRGRRSCSDSPVCLRTTSFTKQGNLSGRARNIFKGSAKKIFSNFAGPDPIRLNVRFDPIVLQKSKIAGLRILAKNPKQEAIADSYNLNRVTDVVYEFDVRR
jgi:hypothetical protein